MSLNARSLRYAYPGAGEPVIRDISFDIPDGSVTSVIGANGVGKSTLVRCLAGICKCEGEVRIGKSGKEKPGRDALFRRIGYMTQESAPGSTLTVLDVVLLGLLGTLHVRVQEEDVEKAAAMLRKLHLEHLPDRPFCTLSGGQRRMVDVAQTLVREPEILIMDEPTANLDLVNELQVLELIRQYTRENGTATLLTLHDLNLAARYSDRLILLKDGRVFREGAPEEVITEETIREAYGVEVHVHISSRTGTPMVLPLRVSETQG